jgi:hypothetical protein
LLVHVGRDGDGSALGERAHGVGEAVVGERRGMNALRELTELPQRLLELASLSARSSLPDGSTWPPRR